VFSLIFYQVLLQVVLRKIINTNGLCGVESLKRNLGIKKTLALSKLYEKRWAEHWPKFWFISWVS
jgi:hypothetical protein